MPERSSITAALTFGIVFVLTFMQAAPPSAVAADEAGAGRTRKIVLVAGALDGHPPGTHEYEKSVLLLKHCLDTAPSLPSLETEVHFGGWPEDPGTLDDADSIVMISAGSDRDETDHPFYVGDRMEVLDRQMARGCGLVAIHWSTFAPLRAKARILRWLGGFFDYESGEGANRWHSTISTGDWDVTAAAPGHPVLEGVSGTFPLREEFYYRLRFLPGSEGNVVPLWRIGAEGGESGLDNVTAWCVERADGGRGFGTTGGHFYANWEVPEFRRTVLNAIVWTAGVAVPSGGVEAEMLEVDETRGLPAPRALRALVLTGHHHPGHDWERVTAVLREVLHRDGRIAVDVTRDPEMLARADLSDYDVLIQNYNNWDRPGWSTQSREAFRRYLADGGGLVVLHFANGAFHRTLPAGLASHWDEYAGSIVRRYWDHGSSGHDPYGEFTVRIGSADHPIIAGLEGGSYPTVDELYFRQAGDLPVEALATARSAVTGRDEPLAFAYGYGSGRVFQSLLGHAPESVGAAGTAELLRRGTLWAAGAELAAADPSRLREPGIGAAASAVPPPTEAFVEGRFGQALDARVEGVLLAGKEEFRTLPLTVECWARLYSKGAFNILAACDPKASLEHWEFYTYAGTGELSLYVPGRGGEFRSGVDVCDGQWHHLTAVIAEEGVQLFVDGREVLARPLGGEAPGRGSRPGGFGIGRLVEGTIGCDGVIDEMRLSSGRRAISGLPAEAPEHDEFTIRLWSLDGAKPVEEAAESGRGDGDGSTVGGFVPRRGPAPGDDDPIALHPFNADRIYDYYRQQAEHFLTVNEQPEVLPQFPGLDEGAFGHWGRRNDDDWRDGSWNRMDLGPVFAGVLHGLGEPVVKAVCARLGDDGGVVVCFDPLTGGIQGAWSGGFVRFDEGRFGLLGGIRVEGNLLFRADNGAGWGGGARIDFAGTHRSARRAVFDYRVNGVGVLDSAWTTAPAEGGVRGIGRELEFEAPMTGNLRLLPVQGALRPVGAEGAVAASSFGHVALRWTSGPEGAVRPAVGEEGLLEVRFENARRCRLEMAFFPDSDPARADSWAAAGTAAPSGLSRWTGGGEPLWPEPLVTRGERGRGEQHSAYVIDTLTVPYDNPWNALFFLSGHDFFSNGDAAVCTIDGDVWTVRGIDEDLDRLEWRRFATGLHQPLGLVVVGDRVHVLGRDQITVLHDRDGNGEADWYENLTNAYTTSAGGHDFITGLERDASGSLYFASGNQGICRVSADGSDLEVLATGIRNPNGLGASSDGTVVASPQEGDWTPASMICVARPGRHFGYRGPRDGRVDPPLCFLPRGVDHSTGGHVFVESDRWGPLGGHLITFSWGNCQAMLTLMENVDGVEQGAVAPLDGEFLSGAHRGRVRPADGQLYVTASTGWGTYATQRGSFQRMRWTGNRTLLIPVAFHARRNGILLRFSDALDPAVAADSERFFVQQWNYEYSRTYGSPEYSVRHPETPGHDRLSVTRTALLPDGRSLFVEMPDLAPVDQIHLHARLRLAGGSAAAGGDDDVPVDLFATLHRLGPVFAEYEGFEARPEWDEAAEDRRRAGRAGSATAADPSLVGGTPAVPLPKHLVDPDLAGQPVHIRCISGLRFDTTEFTVDAGRNVSLTLENTDVIPHNLVIVKPGTRIKVGETASRMLTEPNAVERQYVPDLDEVLVHTLVIDPNQSDTIHFRVPDEPGDYPFLCTFPGHWLIMHGTMHVREADQ